MYMYMYMYLDGILLGPGEDLLCIDVVKRWIIIKM